MQGANDGGLIAQAAARLADLEKLQRQFQEIRRVRKSLSAARKKLRKASANSLRPGTTGAANWLVLVWMKPLRSPKPTPVGKKSMGLLAIGPFARAESSSERDPV